MAVAPGVRIAIATVAAAGVVAGAYAAGRATADDGERGAAQPVAVAGDKGIDPPRLGAVAPLPGMRAVPVASAPTVADSGSGGGSVVEQPSGGGGGNSSTPSTTTPPPASSGGGEVVSEGGGVD